MGWGGDRMVLLSSSILFYFFFWEEEGKGFGGVRGETGVMDRQ